MQVKIKWNWLEGPDDLQKTKSIKCIQVVNRNSNKANHNYSDLISLGRYVEMQVRIRGKWLKGPPDDFQKSKSIDPDGEQELK